MEKQTEATYWLFGSAVLTIILHNLLAAILDFEEPLFFFLALLLLLGFAASVIFNVITYWQKGQPKDIWKLGWLGLIGLLGVLPQFNPGLYGFYGFFGFFGLRKK